MRHEAASSGVSLASCSSEIERPMTPALQLRLTEKAMAPVTALRRLFRRTGAWIARAAALRKSLDHTAALKELSKAAWAGEKDAQYLLGQRYAQGQGVLANMADAVLWYRRAAEQGHCEAQYRLSLVYLNGHGTNGRAGLEEWYRAAAQCDKAAAERNLGLLFP